MRWTEYHPDLKNLYNAIASSHSEQISSSNYNKLTQEIYCLMEKLTLQLNNKEDK